jgi:hypothetical protein
MSLSRRNAPGPRGRSGTLEVERPGGSLVIDGSMEQRCSNAAWPS